MIDAANWADNDRLLSEYTYYERQCDTTDISASNIQSLTLDESLHDANDATEMFMVHGMGMFSNVIDKNVSDDLRNYIRKRNHELTEDEVIPLDTPEKRHSFGIGKFMIISSDGSVVNHEL